MKTIIKILTIIPFVMSILLFSSCSKDRTDANYTSLDDFYNRNQPEEQTFVIDSLGHDSIRGKDGTKIWNLPKTIFMYKSTQKDIYYPFILKLIEAYSLKNMILCRLPNVAQGRILKSGGELKITAFKDNQELALKHYCGYKMLCPSTNPDNLMDVFYGFTKGTERDWNNVLTQTDYIFQSDSINPSSISVYLQNYLVTVAKLGWVNIDRFYSYSNKTNILFTAEGNHTEYIDIYLIFNNLHSFIKINSFVSNNTPIGEAVTVFALAKDNKDNMYYFKQEYITSPEQVIELKMQSATEKEILALMEGL